MDTPIPKEVVEITLQIILPPEVNHEEEDCIDENQVERINNDNDSDVQLHATLKHLAEMKTKCISQRPARGAS